MVEVFARGRQKDLNELITRMAYIAEVKEWDNRQHLERIRRYCHLLSRDLGMSEHDCEVIASASQLHDVGKISTPEALLTKGGQYTDEEWVIVERHASAGAEILSGSTSSLLQMAAAIAQTHHERWDGSGYPNGIAGDKIPLSGRVCALADVFDALTTKRNYKAPMGLEKAQSMIQQAAGVMFDPSLVRIFDQRYEEFCRIKQTLGG